MDTTERRLERLSMPVLILAGIAIVLYLLELFRFIPASLHGVMLWVNFLIDFVFLLDLIAKVVILGTKYVKSPWFLIDLVSTLPIISSATELLGSLGPQLQSTRVARGARVARVAQVARVARVATALRGVRGGFLKTPSEAQATPAFDRALFITIPLLLVIFMAMSYFITQREVSHLQTHLSRQVEIAATKADIAQFPEYLDAQQAGNPQIDKIFVTKIINSKRVKFAFSAEQAHRRSDLLQGLMLVFVLLTTASVVYMSRSFTADQKEEEESILGQFLSPAIVDKINTNPEVLERFYSRWLSVFFVAISGSTRAIGTESNDIEALALLRRRAMDIVRQQTVVVHQGILDKFMGDTVKGWIGGPFSEYWNRLAMFRERLALDELEYVEQDIRSLTRAIDAIGPKDDAALDGEAVLGGLSSDEERVTYLKEALSEVEANRSRLLEKHATALEEEPALQARYEEAMHEYQKQTAVSAVLCCLAIWEEISKQEAEAAFHDLSIGIASGPVSVGNFGSTDQIGFTVLGPTVDRAARLEPASVQCECRMLIDQETYDLVKKATELRFRLVPHISVSGTSEPMATYEPFRAETVSEKFLEVFHEGVFAMQREALEEAIVNFKQADQLRDGGDAVSRLWIEACQAAIREGGKIGVKVIDKS